MDTFILFVPTVGCSLIQAPKQSRLIRHRTPCPSSARPLTRRYPCASLREPQETSVRPGFARGVDDPSTSPRKTFFPERDAAAAAAEKAAEGGLSTSPNDRVLEQVRATMRELGVDENYEPPQPRPFRPMDVSRVNPLSAFAGSLGAAAISTVAWRLLNFVITYALTHQFEDQIYVIQRISTVVRTALVCIFALASGISGVTALGLLLLGFRTTYGAVTGEFRDEKGSKQNASEIDET